jgi:DnaJ domain
MGHHLQYRDRQGAASPSISSQLPLPRRTIHFEAEVFISGDTMPSSPLKPSEDPREVLGVNLEASNSEIRSAYLQKVKAYPPDRFPAEFEKVRDAYEALRDPRARARQLLLSADPETPFISLLEKLPPQRRTLGPNPWFTVLKEKRS